MKSIITLILLTLTFATAFFFASVRADKAHCMKLQAQAEEYDRFFISEVDQEMCNQLNLPVNALIK